MADNTVWWLTGAVTGRLRSGKSEKAEAEGVVNFQNISNNKLLKNVIISDINWRIALEVRTNGRGEVVVNHPDLIVDVNGVGHIIFSPNQARNLAHLLLKHATEAEKETRPAQPIGLTTYQETNMGFRTDDNNNPTAFTTDIAIQAGLVVNEDYVFGSAFPSNEDEQEHTAKLLKDPIATTIQVIDALGYYTHSGVARWDYIALPKFVWNSLTSDQKRDVIGFHYQREGGTAMRSLFPNYGQE